MKKKRIKSVTEFEVGKFYMCKFLARSEYYGTDYLFQMIEIKKDDDNPEVIEYITKVISDNDQSTDKLDTGHEVIWTHEDDAVYFTTKKRYFSIYEL